MNLVTVGHWSLIIGIVLAILSGFANIPQLSVYLFVLGLIVGLLNVSERESAHFLIAVVTLLVIGVAGLQFGGLTSLITNILNNFVAFMAAAALVVAVKQILQIAKPNQQG